MTGGGLGNRGFLLEAEGAGVAVGSGFLAGAVSFVDGVGRCGCCCTPGSVAKGSR